MEKRSEVCEDIFRHPNNKQDHQGQSSKVCGHVVSDWRHHGTAHWVLHHQRSGDSLLCHKSCLEETLWENNEFTVIFNAL